MRKKYIDHLGGSAGTIDEVRLILLVRVLPLKMEPTKDDEAY